MISGIVTAILIAAFIGIFFWAWAPRRKQAFIKAAAMPLVEDVPVRRAANDEVQP